MTPVRPGFSAVFKSISFLGALCLGMGVTASAHAQSFAAPVITPSPQPDQILSGDLQGLGRADLFYVTGGAANGWVATSLLNDGAGHFTPAGDVTGPYSYLFGWNNDFNHLRVLLADFDGDGHPDLAAAVSTGNDAPDASELDVWNGAGKAGSFYDQLDFTGLPPEAMSAPLAPDLAFLQAVPLKTGALPQLLVEDSANASVYLLQNSPNAAGSLGPPANFSVVNSFSYPLADGAGPMTVGDLNNDGNTDFILNGQTGQSALVYLGNGDGTFQPPVRSTFDNGVSSLLLHDMDGDGILDLVITDTTGNVEAFHGDGDGTFASTPLARWANTLGATGQILTVADLNADGIPDLLLGSSAGVSILLGSKSGSYTLQGTYPAGGGHTTWAVADYNSDGLLDVAVDSPAGVAILYGQRAAAAAALIPTKAELYTCVDPPLSNYPCASPPSQTTTQYPQIVMYYGQNVDGGYEVLPQDPSSTASVTGKVSLYYGSELICNALLDGVTADSSCNTAPAQFQAGTQPIYLVYAGNTTFAGSTSIMTPLTVLPDPTTTLLMTSNNPAVAGTPVTFTATVQGNIVPAAGSVTFFDAGTAIGTGTLNASGIAIFTTSTLAIGTHPITAGYAATLDFNASASSVVNQVITLPPYATGTTLQSSDNPSFPGQSVTFTATVSGPVSPPGVPLFLPTGTVNFLDAGTLIGTGTLNASGMATFTTSTLAIGTHPITAAYTGVSGPTYTLSPSTSAVLDQVVDTPTFSITVTPNPVSVEAGDLAALLVTVTNIGGPPTVTLSCSNLPYESQCAFGQTTISGSGSVPFAYETTAPHACGTNSRSYGLPATASAETGPSCTHSATRLPARARAAREALGWGGPMLAGLLLLLPGRRRWKRGPMLLLLMLATLAGLSTLNGCGGACTDLGTFPSAYRFTVTATAVADTMATPGAASTTVQVTVQP